MESQERPSQERANQEVPGTRTQAPWHSSRQTWIALSSLLLVSIPMFFFQLGGWGFIDPDEGRYGEIPREMLARHDWITPMLNYVKFFDKPPLLYWGIAASYSVFGLQEWAARLIPALAALAGMLVTYALGRRMFGPRAGFLSALILATTLMWPVMARVVVTDMLVSSLVFIALALWWLGHSEETTHSQRNKTAFYLGFWIVLALAVLTKGPVTLVLTGGAIFLYLLLCRQWKALGGMKWLPGIPLFLVVAVPWFVVVAQRNIEFNHVFWYEEHVGRFLGKSTDRDHANGPFYFLELLPLVFFPWSIFAPAALAAGWKKIWPARSQKQRAIIYLLCGCVFTIFFFSISDSKLVTYILPVLPLLSILLAAYFDRLLAAPSLTRSRPLAISATFLAFLAAAGGVVIIQIGPKQLLPLEVGSGMAVILGALLIAWAVVLVAAAWHARAASTLAAVAGGFMVIFTGAILLVSVIAPAITTKPLFAIIQPGLGEKTEVISVGFTQSISFYARRRVHLEGKSDELTYGLEHMPLEEKQRWFLKGNTELRALMSKSTPVYCVIRKSRGSDKKAQRTLRELEGVAVEIVSNYRSMVIGNQAAVALTPPVRSGRKNE